MRNAAKWYTRSHYALPGPTPDLCFSIHAQTYNCIYNLKNNKGNDHEVNYGGKGTICLNSKKLGFSEK
ncbi:MAG: hypothetical protein ABFR35_06580, partial [Thermodesulfobacteriota bacterium]